MQPLAVGVAQVVLLESIAELDATTGEATAWNPGAALNYVRTLAVRGDLVYAGGEFQFIGGQNRNYLAALDATTGLATSWNPDLFGPSAGIPVVMGLAVDNDLVVAGGRFTTAGGRLRQSLAVFDQ